MAFLPWRVFGRPLRNLFGSSGGGNPNAGYLLRDTFSVDKAAGSVNGSLCDTGQARTVTDSGNRVSIAGGSLVQSGNHAAAGDPGLWYPSIPRVVGQVLGFQITPVTNAALMAVGFDVNQAGFLAAGFYFQNAGDLRIVDGAGGQVLVVGTYTATSYFVKIIPRATGYWLFIKGGLFINWTLYYICPNGSNATIFPNIGAGGAGANGGSSFDFDNIPISIYIPQPLAYDTFTRANGALGSTETSGPDGQVLTALAWLFTAGIWAIVSNAAVGTPTQGADVVVNGGFNADTDWTKGAGWAIAAGLATATAASSNLTAIVAPLTNGVWYQSVYTLSAFAAGTVRARLGGTNCPTRNANGTYTETQRAGGTSLVAVGSGFTGSIDNWSVKALTLKDLFASLTLSTADVWAYVNVTLENATSGKQAGLVLNLDSDTAPANFILVYLDGQGNVQIDECVAGVYTAKQTTAITYSAGATLSAVRDGTSLRVFYNNVGLGTAQTMTANTNTKHGIFSTSPLSSVDNALFMPRGNIGTEYSGLDAFAA